MTTKAKDFFRGVLPLGENTRLGAKFARPLSLLSTHSEEGRKLASFYLKVQNVAMRSADEKTCELFVQAAEQIDKFASSVLKGEELAIVRREIEHTRHTIFSRWWSEGAPMPEWARSKALLADATHMTLNLEIARSHSVFRSRMARLMKANPSAAEEVALVTYRRMLDVIGTTVDNGWSRIFDYCAKHAEGIAEKAQLLRAAEAKVANLPASVARETLLRAQAEARAWFYPIRGELGEVYLHHWPNWHIQRSSLEEIAESVAQKLPGKWEPERFSGGALIDGHKAWDEGILLLKTPTSNDRIPRAALHTGVQVKVENILTALEQTIQDRLREIGASFEPPILSIIKDGYRRDFVLEVLPPNVEVVRYIFNARDGHITASSVARLKQAGLQATAMPMDISIDEFDAVTRQIMYAVEEYVAKKKSAP